MEGGLDRDHDISMPTKLTQLRYSGYSAEFLDRVEPNGNIPGKNGTSIAGNYLCSTIMGRNEKENFSFSFFLSFSFLGEKWRTRNEKLWSINKEFIRATNSQQKDEP